MLHFLKLSLEVISIISCVVNDDLYKIAILPVNVCYVGFFTTNVSTLVVNSCYKTRLKDKK